MIVTDEMVLAYQQATLGMSTCSTQTIRRGLEAALCEATNTAVEALKPFATAIHINDHDSLSRLRRDNEVIAWFSGSWSKTVKITLGDLRVAAAAYRDARPKEILS